MVEDVDWINWAKDRDRSRAFVNTLTNLRVRERRKIFDYTSDNWFLNEDSVPWT